MLGFLLPAMMAPASKSSPLFLCIAAALAAAAAVSARGAQAVLSDTRAALTSAVGIAALALLAFMAASCLYAHNPRSSLLQFAQLLIVVAAGFALTLCFPAVAPRRRALLFAAGSLLAAAVIYADLVGGLWMRGATGGRIAPYAYNRGLVTLTVLLWPLLALIVAARKLWLLVPFALFLPVAVFRGESGTAEVALVGGALVLPVALLLPRFTRWAGLAGTLALLAVQPWFGTLMQRLLSEGFHKRFEEAHSSDRVDIWLSFEAAARARLLFGNGFGASLNLQDGAVAKELQPGLAVLLGASHPHNGFLQIWVELGLAGAALCAVLIAALFAAIGRLRPALQPFALTCAAVCILITLVSHGAWQAWWWAAMLAAIACFAALERELRQGTPPL